MQLMAGSSVQQQGTLEQTGTLTLKYVAQAGL